MSYLKILVLMLLEKLQVGMEVQSQLCQLCCSLGMTVGQEADGVGQSRTSGSLCGMAIAHTVFEDHER